MIVTYRRAWTKSLRRCVTADSKRSTRETKIPKAYRLISLSLRLKVPMGLSLTASSWSNPVRLRIGGSKGAPGVTPRGLRTLYVALTRPSRRLAIIACEELPTTLG